MKTSCLKYLVGTMFLIFIKSKFLIAQNSYIVKIKILNKQNETMYGAHVQLSCGYNKYNAISDEKGIVVFNNLKKCEYKIKISYIGYNTIDTTLFIDRNEEFTFYLKENTISLKEVEIVSKKPLIKQEEEKTIINPEPIVTVSSNTMEVLESVPGVYIDPDGYIYIAGTRPATIYINGQEQKLSADEIATILRNLPPDAIEKIEIIRSPSAKYDAATTGGIVNIILKKGIKIGQFGTISLGANQGLMGNRLASFSYSNQVSSRFSLFSSISYNKNSKYEQILYNREVLRNTILKSNSENRSKNDAVNINSNLTFNIDTTKSLIYDLRISYSSSKNISSSLTDVYSFNSTSLTSENNSDAEFSYLNFSNDITFTYKLDTLNSIIEVKTGYNHNNKCGNQNYENVAILPTITEVNGKSEINSPSNNYYVSCNLNYKLPFNLKIESGFNLSFFNFKCKNNFFNIYQFNPIADTNKSSFYKYTENIQAIYFQLSKELFWKIIVKPGFRIEHTFMNGEQYFPSNSKFKISRTDFFPFVYIGRKIFQFKDFELYSYFIYRKSITRPEYKSLNPAITYIDEFNYQQGNPNLKPQFTENYEFNISYKEYPVFAVGKLYTKNIFSEVTYTDSLNIYRIVRTYDNLGKAEQLYLRGMIGIPPGGIYFFGVGFQYIKDYFSGYYQNIPFIYKNSGWRLFSFHQLKLFKNTKITMSAFWLLGGMWNFYELDNFGQINIGLNQNLFKNKITLNVYFRDVFNTNKNKFKLIVPNINATGERKSDTQRLGINVKYNFGIKKKEEKGKFFNIENNEE
ncbi:MAG: outer membrane beta-barrel protein [Bacteroidales bacterium]|nr:outer membrane beta-barrel protein [Bacteroidales bacterium]